MEAVVAMSCKLIQTALWTELMERFLIKRTQEHVHTFNLSSGLSSVFQVDHVSTYRQAKVKLCSKGWATAVINKRWTSQCIQ